MKLHPRTRRVRTAAVNFKTQIDQFQIAHDLTDVEMLGILHEVAALIAKYMLRDERHPDDSEKGADEA